MVRRTRRQRGGLFGYGFRPVKNPFTQPTAHTQPTHTQPTTLVVNPMNPTHAVGNPKYISLENIKNKITGLASARAHEIDELIIGIQGTIDTITSLEDKNKLLQFVLLKINAACNNGWFSYEVTPWVLNSLVTLAIRLFKDDARTTTRLDKCVTKVFSNNNFDLPNGFKLINMLNSVVGGNRKQKRSRRYRSRSRRSRA